MKKIITILVLMMVAVGCFAEERIEYFGNYAVFYDTEWVEESVSDFKYEMNKVGWGYAEKTFFGVFLTEEDSEFFRRTGTLRRAMEKADEYKAEQKTDFAKALYRAMELALEGIEGVQLWQRDCDPCELKLAVFYKASEGFVKYFTVIVKE